MILMLFLQTDHSCIQRDNLPSPPASDPPLGGAVGSFLLLDCTYL